MNQDMQWSFYKLWNESVDQGRVDRPFKARETLWASELGGPMIDRYLKFTNVKPSNPFDARSFRKFEAGNIWEWLVGLVLKRAGILLDSQEWLKFQYPGALAVTGKLDYLAGGKVDVEKARAELAGLELPELFSRATDRIITYFADKYPDGLPPIVLEIKSSSSFMFERYLTLNVADIRHMMQNFHYLKAKNLPEGHVVYISKDDSRMLEVPVFNPSVMETHYENDIRTFSNYIFNKEQPPLEKHIVYMPETCRFSANFKVGYSGYLTLLYGMKDQAEFDARYKPTVAKWNRVFNRVINKDNMTALNLEVIKEIEQTFPNFVELVDNARNLKNKGLINIEEEENG